MVDLPHRPQTVVLLSGGLDSAANLALAHARGDRLAALTVNYGQRAWNPNGSLPELWLSFIVLLGLRSSYHS